MLFYAITISGWPGKFTALEDISQYSFPKFLHHTLSKRTSICNEAFYNWIVVLILTLCVTFVPLFWSSIVVDVEHLPAFLSNHFTNPHFQLKLCMYPCYIPLIPLSQGVYSACLLKLGLDVSNSGRPITLYFRVSYSNACLKMFSVMWLLVVICMHLLIRKQ